jgi:DNA-binding transcriptional ArsR family regulator
MPKRPAPQSSEHEEDRHKSPFTLLFLAPLRELVTQTSRELTKVELRVLLYLICDASYHNTATAYIGSIADELGNDRSTISKALTCLSDLELVSAERNTRGGATTWRVNPELAFRGRANLRARHRRQWNRQRTT